MGSGCARDVWRTDRRVGARRGGDVPAPAFHLQPKIPRPTWHRALVVGPHTRTAAPLGGIQELGERQRGVGADTASGCEPIVPSVGLLRSVVRDELIEGDGTQLLCRSGQRARVEPTPCGRGHPWRTSRVEGHHPVRRITAAGRVAVAGEAGGILEGHDTGAQRVDGFSRRSRQAACWVVAVAGVIGGGRREERACLAEGAGCAGGRL